MKYPSDFFIILSSVFFTCSAYNECLTDVSITEISSEQANITWTFGCDENLITGFKIFYDHINYKACKDEDNSIKEHPKKTAGNIREYSRWKKVGPLQPFSDYEFIVRPRFRSRNHEQEEMVVRGTTERELPTVKVRAQGAETGASQIRFLIEGVDQSQCEQFNDDLGYVRYHVKGKSPWNKHFDLMDHVSWDASEILVRELLPNSKYGLALFVTDRNGNYKGDAGFDFTATTRQSPPTEPPTDVRLDIKGRECSVVWRDAYPPVGDVDYYVISFKQDDGDWETDRIEAREVQILRIEGEEEEILEKSYMLPMLSEGSIISVKIRSFNKGFSDGSEWSLEASNTSETMRILIIAIIALFLLGLLIFFTMWVRRWVRVRRYEAAKTDDYSQRPIIRELDPRGLDNSANGGSRHPSLQPPSLGDSRAASVASSSPGSEVELRKGGQGQRGSRRSGLDPLPPVPGEPLYEELKNPEQLPLDEEQYLEPNPVKIASVESLDEEGYLKPNFHRVQPFNTRSPTRESPEPIPMVSYSSQDELERDKV